MGRALRLLLIAAGSIAGLLAIAVLAAWFLMPKNWIDQEAKRQAAKVEGATIRWNTLRPGFSWLALGVRVDGLHVRVPAEGKGDASLEANVGEVFVSFRLLPLLARRVEISAARVNGAKVAMTDRGAPLSSAAGAPPAAGSAGLALILPRFDFNDIDIRTRDLLGGGIDLVHLSGKTEFDGSVDHPHAIRIAARGESLLWKPSAKDPSVALPGPLKIDLAAEARDGGARLALTRGTISLGPLQSELSGEVRMPGSDRKEPEFALVVTGKPQSIRSSDEAFKSLGALSPATWSTTASWDIRVNGGVSAPIQTGNLTLKPLAITAASNSFTLDQATASWSVRPDKTYTATVHGGGSGVKLALDAAGSTAPGGASSGTIDVSGPATRLNGLVPNTPTWASGELECRASFSLRPPAPPAIHWVIQGKGLSGTVPGLLRPVSSLGFDLAGDDRLATIRSFHATVGSTTASLTGSIEQGKPLGTGTFTATIDRFVAEEWAPPPPAKGAAIAKGAVAPAPAPLPIPLRAFDATVSIGELRSGGMTVRDVVVPVKFADGSLVAAPIKGRIGTGTIAGELDLNHLTGTPSYSMNLDVHRAPVEELLASIVRLKFGLTGFASGGVNLAGPGLPGAALTDSIRGALSGMVEDGKIQETPTIAGIRNALGLASGTESGAALAFKTLTHSLRIDRGRLLLDKINGDLGKDLFEMTGSMGLDQTLDMNLLLRLAPERIKGGTALAQLAQYAKDKDGRLPVEVKITGTTLAPKISFKASKALDAAGAKLGQELIKSLTESGRHDSSRTDSIAAADDPVKKAREALKRLFHK